MRILCWNVNGLYTTLKDAAARHASASNYFAQALKADIVCFQEAKIQEEKLEKWMACVEGYDSHWAFSQAKKGYSGVVTYVKEEFAPLDAKADWLVGEESDLCKEGRLMCTDHGSFVLFNVYVPNAGDRDEGRPRLEFKMRYLKALEQTCDEVVRSGKHVMVVGDFNVAHKAIDVHARWNVEETYSLEEREWLDGFLSKYVDLYRHFHPDEREVYSVWNQKTEARIHNEGLRIDYAICDKGFLEEVLEADIVKMQKQWSDHAAVVVVLKEQPGLPPHPAPALSSRSMKRFNEDPRQKKLTALFFNKPGGPNKCDKPPLKPPPEGTQGLEEHSTMVQPAGSPGTTATLSNTNCDLVPESVKCDSVPESLASLSEGSNKRSEPSPKKKHQSHGRGQAVAGKRKAEAESKAGPNPKQRSVASFFKLANTK